MKLWAAAVVTAFWVAAVLAGPVPQKPANTGPKSGEKDLQTVDLRLLDARARAGSVEAQVDLGIIYFEGKRVPQNLALARAWWALAAKNGSEIALANLRLLDLKDDDEEGGVSFFGTPGRGHRFAFVIDKSGSMEGEPFRAARAELVKCMKQLPRGSPFMIYFFDDEAEWLPSKNPPTAVPADFRWVEDWIWKRDTGGGTNPIPALSMALKFQPDTLWILSDGQFFNANGTIEQLKRANPRKQIRINTIGFYDRSGEKTLKAIADAHDGRYRFVVRE